MIFIEAPEAFISYFTTIYDIPFLKPLKKSLFEIARILFIFFGHFTNFSSTLFNFQNRLSEHFPRKGENILEHVFDELTEKQLKTLKVKTNIQRTDSTLAVSNIRNYARLQLLVETLIHVNNPG